MNATRSKDYVPVVKHHWSISISDESKLFLFHRNVVDRESINVTYVEGNHILLDMIRECRIKACTFHHVTLLLKTINEEMKM